jgi:hypothetical protein
VQDVAKSLCTHLVIGRHVLYSPEILPACSSGTVPYLGRGMGSKYLGMRVCVQGFDMIVCLQTGSCLGLTSRDCPSWSVFGTAHGWVFKVVKIISSEELIESELYPGRTANSKIPSIL